MTGLDPEGCDLASGDETARLIFPECRQDAGGAAGKHFRHSPSRRGQQELI